MLFNRKRKQQPEHKLLVGLDIGTEYIKTVLFYNKNGQIEIVGYDKSPQKRSAMRGALIINLPEVVDVVDLSIGKALKMAEDLTGQSLSLPESVILGIAGELVKGVPIVVNVEREHGDEPISRSELNEVVKQIKAQTFDSARERIALDTGIKTSQIKELDTRIDTVEIDGVQVTDAEGMTGSELTYRVFSTFAPKLHVNAVAEVAKLLNLKVLSVEVEPYVLSLAFTHPRRDTFSGIFIDVGGGTTDIAVVSQGRIVGTRMFAFGGRAFTKRIMNDLNIDYAAAEQMKLNYANDALNQTEKAQVRKALAKDIPIWADGVEVSLSAFDDVDEFPSTIYICGGGSQLPEIRERLISHPWIQTLPFGRLPKVEYMYPNQVRDLVDLTKKATDPSDVTPLALARMILDLEK